MVAVVKGRETTVAAGTVRGGLGAETWALPRAVALAAERAALAEATAGAAPAGRRVAVAMEQTAEGWGASSASEE